MKSADIISENVKQLGVLCNMTISGAAKDLGISRQTAAKYVKGEIFPGTAALMAFCRIIGVPFDTLLLPEGELENAYRIYAGLDACERDFVSYYRKISGFQKGYLLEVAKKGCERIEAEYAERTGCESEEAALIRRNDS